MALQNHPDLYTGGSERVDSRPHTMLYAQLMARKQAKEEAFDDYIRNLNKNINPAGMRNQEREIFEEKLKQWTDYGIQNRESIRNPRKDQGQASMQFQAGYQDLQNLIAESKTREEGKKPVIPMLLDPDKRDRMGEEFMTEISTHDAPLYTRDEGGRWVRNPQSRAIDITKLNFDPKPFDQGKYFQTYDDVKPSDKSQTVKSLPGLKEEITTTAIFSPQDKDAIATRSVAEYMGNKSFKKVVDQLDPKEYNDFFKQEFGHDIKTPADLAAAYTLQGIQQKNISKEIKDDSFAQRKALANLNDALSRGRMSMRRAWQKADKATQDIWVDGQIAQMVEAAKRGGEVAYKDASGNTRFGFKIPLDPNMAAALTRDKRQPEALRLNADGTYQPIYIKYGKDGKAERKNGSYVIDEDYSVPLTYEQLKAAYSKQFGVKQANLEMGGNDGDGGESESGSETIGILD